MPKVYEPTKVVEQLFLTLRALPGRIAVSLVQNDGGHIANLAYINDSGIVMAKELPEDVAARAGFSPEALDSNGRLKVIGQESVEAERMESPCYESCDRPAAVARFWSTRQDTIAFDIVVDGVCGNSIRLTESQTRDLAARLNRHVAFLDKEGL